MHIAKLLANNEGFIIHNSDFIRTEILKEKQLGKLQSSVWHEDDLLCWATKLHSKPYGER